MGAVIQYHKLQIEMIKMNFFIDYKTTVADYKQYGKYLLHKSI